MNKMRITFAVIFAVFGTAVLAQTKVSGQATLGGGLGTATPWDADVRLEVSNNKVNFRPYVGIEGITKDASEEVETLDYSYRSGEDFSSWSGIQSEGYTLNYGGRLNTNFSPANELQIVVDASHRSMESVGESIEGLVNLMSSIPVPQEHSDIMMPVRDQNELKANASWIHKTQRPRETLTLRYGFERLSTENELNQNVTNGQMPLLQNNVFGDASTQTHSVSFDWMRPLMPGQSLTLGARYEDKQIKSHDRQEWNGATLIDSHFTHTTKTSGINVGYLFSFGPVVGSTSLGYDYTDMWNKTLHDFIPQARGQWNIDDANSLMAMYARRIVRPYLEVLNPTKVIGPYTLDYGNPDLEGTHINIMSLIYQHKAEHATFTTTAQHIRVEDGFNAIWMVNESDMGVLAEPRNIRVSTWGNQGVRRAWSVAPELMWTPAKGTMVTAKATLLWDKRIAYAINMAKEHWGITTNLRLDQQLPAGIQMAVHADYSEGNTIDLYSHASRSMDMGAELHRAFCHDKLTAKLAYTYREYAKTILTQGAYTGVMFRRPDDRNAVSLALSYKL